MFLIDKVQSEIVFVVHYFVTYRTLPWIDSCIDMQSRVQEIHATFQVHDIARMASVQLVLTFKDVKYALKTIACTVLLLFGFG